MAYRKFAVYFCGIVVLLTTAPQIESACSGTYNCVTDTIFQLCVDDAMSPEPNRCMEGTKCHANCITGEHPCVEATKACANPPPPPPPPPPPVVVPTECNVAGFMCTGYTTVAPIVSDSFVNCIGSSVAPTADALLDPNFCPPSHVCDMNCADECRHTSRPACPASSGTILCTAPGRVANPQVVKNYFLCAKITAGGYAVQEYACPGKSVFNATTLKCVYPEFECVAAGKFPDPKSCLHYYSCFGVLPTMSATHYKCPAGSSFDPTTKKCGTTYVCSIVTTTPPTGVQSTTDATTARPQPTTAAPSYRCTRAGKFVYPGECRK